MTLRFESAALLTLPLTLALCVSACGDDAPGASSDESGTDESGESGETTGDGDGDPATGDGDGDPTTGDGDGDQCPVGSEGCPCTGGGSCDAGLMCEGGLCVPVAGDGDGDMTGDGDGDMTGDGDGDMTGDGDGDPNQCPDESFEILAVDATDSNGWDVIMSDLGEGMILGWDMVTQDASVSFDFDIPCEDDWHVWIRGVDNGDQDSYFVLVDGEPMPIPVFELDCTGEPMGNGIYRWTELNWREQDADACDYVEDPWIQAWGAGQHNITLGFRESIALSRIWITNTNDMPPMP